MRWEERLLQELDDLEQQAEGLHLAERDALVAELSVSAYAEVDLASRLHASIGSTLSVTLRGAGVVEGILTRAGRDWLLVRQERTEAIVPTAAVLRVRGASERSVPASVRTVTSKLGVASVLRQVAAGRESVAVTLVDGSVLRGQIRRVGADFVEVAGDGGAVELVGFDVLVLLRRV